MPPMEAEANATLRGNSQEYPILLKNNAVTWSCVSCILMGSIAVAGSG